MIFKVAESSRLVLALRLQSNLLLSYKSRARDRFMRPYLPNNATPINADDTILLIKNSCIESVVFQIVHTVTL